MASKLMFAALVSAVAVYCTTAAPFTANALSGTSTTTSPVILDAIVRFRRSAASPEESVHVILARTAEGGIRVNIGECPPNLQGCNSVEPVNSVGQTTVRKKRTINMNTLLSILRAILKLFGIRIPDELFNLLTGLTNNTTPESTTAGRRTSAGTSTSSSGALNLEALLG